MNELTDIQIDKACKMAKTVIGLVAEKYDTDDFSEVQKRIRTETQDIIENK